MIAFPQGVETMLVTPLMYCPAAGSFGLCRIETALTAVSRGRIIEKDGSTRPGRANAQTAGGSAGRTPRLLWQYTSSAHPAVMLTAKRPKGSVRARAVAITPAMTVIILIFAEVLPKTLAIALSIVSRCSSPCPCGWWLAWRHRGDIAVAGVERLALFGVGAEEEPGTEGRMTDRGSGGLHHREGNVEREHRDMIGGIWICGN
jgi:Mg2+/Co2+ transporter CorB